MNDNTEPDAKVQITDCDDISGIGVGSAVDENQDMEFLNEACVQGAVKTGASWWRRFRFLKEPSVDVSPFFARPVRIASGSVVSGLNYATNLDATFFHTAGGTTMWADKCAGYAGFRGTWCFRVNVSTTPFVGGVLRLVHYPKANNYVSLVEPIPNALVRQLPGVNLDVNTNTSAVLKIPHRALYPYMRMFDITSTVTTNGVFHLRTYLPMNFIAPSVAPDYEIWMWMEDLEFIGIKNSTSNLAVVLPASGSGSVATSGEVPNGRPISSFLNAASKLSMWTGTMIPALSTHLLPLTWITRVGAKVASALGYSRPINQQANMPVKSMEWGNLANATGVSTSYNTGLFHDTQVAVAPYCADDEDVLSFDFHTVQMHYMGKFNLGAQPAGTLIAKGQLNPHALYTSPNASFVTSFEQIALVTPTNEALWPSPAMGVAQFFNYWRGGFKYRFVFNKTKFHTGRLLFGYDYNPKVLTTLGLDACAVPNYASTAYSHRVVIDLREGNDFEVTVPWFCVDPFVTANTSIGSWYMYVVDPLRYSGQVATSIDIYLEASMTPGSNFQAPRPSGYTPDDTRTNIIAASGGASVSTSYDSTPLDLLATGFGEKVESFKQLAARPARRTGAVSGFWSVLPTTRTAGVFDIPVNYGPLDWVRRITAVEKGSIINILTPTSDANYSTFHTVAYLPWSAANVQQNAAALFFGKNDEFHSHIVQRYAAYGGTYNQGGVLPVSTELTDPSLLRYYNIRGTETNNYMTSVADDYGAHLFKGTTPLVPNALVTYITF